MIGSSASGSNGSATAGRTVASFFAAFGPAPPWEEIVRWPPDVFALANLVMDHTECYRFVVAPPPGRSWPPLPDWDEQVRRAARSWRVAATGDAALPRFVEQVWRTLTRHRTTDVAAMRSGEAWEAVEALLTLHATADDACADVALSGGRAPDRSFSCAAWELLAAHGSLSRLSPARVRIVPKTGLSPQGMTIRSLSRHLALCYESVDVRWRRAGTNPSDDDGRFHVVLLPWPLSVAAHDFHPLTIDRLENLDATRFGFFGLHPKWETDSDLAGALLRAAREKAGRVDAVVLPECAIDPGDIPYLEEQLDAHGVPLLVAGVRGPADGRGFGRNYLHFGTRTPDGWLREEQDKHHRWCLDGRQIRQYHLTRSLAPTKLWWEAMDMRERTLYVVDVGSGVTVAPLVCEDLARLDEVADLVRRIGPSLVVALLLDGPQLSTRWSSRYARVIADEPGSSVLTLTSYGMVARSTPAGRPRSRVVAHWCDGDGSREIALQPGASGILLSTELAGRDCFTADGRRHVGMPRLIPTGAFQLRTARPRARRRVSETASPPTSRFA